MFEHRVARPLFLFLGAMPMKRPAAASEAVLKKPAVEDKNKKADRHRKTSTERYRERVMLSLAKFVCPPCAHGLAIEVGQSFITIASLARHIFQDFKLLLHIRIGNALQRLGIVL
jgi:hypothetical protein